VYMSTGTEKTTLEVIAPTTEDAISKGLRDLGLPAEAVEVEILDAGNKGLFGLGSRQARVRLTVKNQASEPVVQVKTATLAPQAEKAAVPAVDEDDPALDLAATVVLELLQRMKVRAQVSASYLDAADSYDEPIVLVDILGDDLSILIGRRSETLNALQYITGLIVGKELGRWVPLMIDVQGYRQRRERQLRQLAKKMADQAVQTGRRQTLEPMPANERRVIHLELRNHPQVTTESVGEEPNRKVTIFLKK
jgi:spoIIIJ-associated protein